MDSDDDGLALNCGAVAMGINDGIAETGLAAIEAPDVVIMAEGQLDLGREYIDVKVETFPRSGALVSLRAPARVHGPWLDPEVDIDTGPLLLHGAAAALLYSITPPAALFALLESGVSEDEVPCLEGL